MIIKPSEISLPEGFSFRKANNRDSEKIQEIVFSALKEHDLIPAPETTDSDLIDVESAYEDGFFGVIIQNENIVATFGLSPINTKVTEIRKMYSIPSVRGRGLGKWMVNYLIQISKDNNFCEVELETASTLRAAINLYKKIGFREKEFENKTPRCDKAFFMEIS